MAKESADVVILDDNFSTIVNVAKWGRSVYTNIQKFVQFQLTVNLVALILNFSSACITGKNTFVVLDFCEMKMVPWIYILEIFTKDFFFTMTTELDWSFVFVFCGGCTQGQRLSLQFSYFG